jgi:hypothetical protein
MNVTECPFPFCGDACNMTLAQAYPFYHVFHICYVTAVFFLTCFTAWQTVNLFRLKERLCPMDVQQSILLLINIACITFIVRAIGTRAAGTLV